MRRHVVVGTAKGAFVLDGAEVSNPVFVGEQVYALGVDARRDPPRLFAGTTSEHWGSIVRSSDNLGATWTDPEIGNLRFPRDTGASVAHVWQVQPAGAGEPDVVYAGVEPAALFRSDDGGASFALVRGLWDHPDRPGWVPGFGGQCLHSVVVDAGDHRRLLVAISAGGIYRSNDRGETWRRARDGIPDRGDDPGLCVHRAAADVAEPQRVFLQGHWGMYRTDDFGDRWVDITGDLPSDFGFPLVTHPRRAGTAYLIPLESEEVRWMPDARCAVFRTDDAGASWTALTAGLPQERAYLTVLRDAFCTDAGDPAGLYFGTRSGDVYGSVDEGETWELLASRLPPVLSVRAFTMA